MRKATKKTFDTSDYRAPDTAAVLLSTKPEPTVGQAGSSNKQPSTAAVKKHVSFAAPPDTAVSALTSHELRLLQSYQFKNNSCYIDTGLELLFRAFAFWLPSERTDFIKAVSKDSFLFSLFYQFDRRLKWIGGITTAAIGAYTQSLLEYSLCSSK